MTAGNLTGVLAAVFAFGTAASASEPGRPSIAPRAEALVETALGRDVSLVWSQPQAVSPTDRPASSQVAAHADGAPTARLAFPPLGEAVTADPSGAVPVSYSPQDVPPGWRREGDALRHGLSGMICPFATGLTEETAGRQIVVGLQGIRHFDDEGSDVVCAYASPQGDHVYSLFASRWPQTTAEAHFDEAVGLISRDVPVGTQVPVLSTLAGKMELPGGLPDQQALAIGYDFALPDGTTGETALWLTKVGDWHVKMRGTYVPGSEMGQVLGLILHTVAVDQVSTGASVDLSRTVRWIPRERDDTGLALPTSLTTPPFEGTDPQAGVAHHLPRF